MTRTYKILVYFLVAIAFVSSNSVIAANLVVNPGFETPEAIENVWPSTIADWSGDAAAIVTAENGITPAQGTNMLHFIFGGATAGPLGSSEVIQLFDMSSLSTQINAGLVTANASFLANRVSGDAQTDTEFVAVLKAHGGALANFPTDIAFPMASQFGSTITDGDVNTWEAVSVQWLIPAGTNYLSFAIASQENIFNDTSGTEFDGHYADSVSLSLSFAAVPVPPAVWLFGSGLIGLVGMARRKKAA